MRREYVNWWSDNLDKKMELIVFGDFGFPYIVFPTSKGRFFEWEDYGMIHALKEKIENKIIKLYCIDSIDKESWYAFHHQPPLRLKRHLQWEDYIIKEVIKFIRKDCRDENIPIGATGASFGAYHAVNFFFKHPSLFKKILAMSGIYDIRFLLHGYHDMDVYYNNPIEFIPNLSDESILSQLRQSLKINLVTGTGAWEENAVSSSKNLSDILNARNIHHNLYVWGPEVEHHWYWWKKQAEMYLE